MRLETKTRAAPDRALDIAIDYFSTKQGLTVIDRTRSSARFEGGGGHVTVEVRPEGAGSAVELTETEWEYQVKEFARLISRTK